ncbi:hypothetical protein, partial [Streptomyces sp. NPDC020996]|uniref:hypothetical protein n=1 Tax=Streptomyces sp. NPDC020996 TaxID=3154791 RepID=UPI0033D51D8C
MADVFGVVMGGGLHRLGYRRLLGVARCRAGLAARSDGSAAPSRPWPARRLVADVFGVVMGGGLHRLGYRRLLGVARCR